MKMVVAFLKDESGGGLVEYAFLTAASALGLIAALAAFADHFNYRVEDYLQELLPMK